MNYKSKQQMIKTIGYTVAIIAGIIASINQFIFMQKFPSIALTGPGVLGSFIAAVGTSVMGGLIGFTIGIVLAFLMPKNRTQCPQCGNANAISADRSLLNGKPYPNKCRQCGHIWKGSSDESTETAPIVFENKTEDENKSQQEKETKKCPNCGNPCESDYVFCNMCAYKF